jgi:hypothetical protein
MNVYRPRRASFNPVHPTSASKNHRGSGTAEEFKPEPDPNVFPNRTRHAV